MKRQRTALPPLKAMAAALATCFTVNAQALPTAPVVTNGSASFQQTGNSLTVTNSNGAIIHWNSFSVGTSESTRFIQSSASSSVLNRVVGSDPSSIYGTLSSNGRIYLVNPAGIYVGPGGRVDAAAFIASSLALSDSDFLAGRLVFNRDSQAGAVENHGFITTPEGGSVYLIGSSVDNSGSIEAPNGEVVLAAGQSVQLVNTGTPGVTVEFSASDESVQNFGTIAATGGQIGLAGALVKNAGTLNASSVSREGGRVFLRASRQVEVDAAGRIVADGTRGGTVELQSDDQTLMSGSIEARGSADEGGRVEVLGDKVGLFGSASIDASGQSGGGTILVGGDFQGKNPEIRNAFVTWVGSDTSLKANAVEAGDGGKIIVWSDDTTRAYGNIEAKGGKTTGNGGFVEVSGKRYLDYQGLTSTSAEHGQSGTLLLDPMDITIIDGGVDTLNGATFNGSGPAVFESASYGSTAQITWGTIASQLTGGDVIISTSSAGFASGNITVAYGWAANNPLTITHVQDVGSITRNYIGLLNTPNDLTLLAHNDIQIDADFGNAGTGKINLYAGWNGADPLSPSLSNANGDIFVNATVASNGPQEWRAPGLIQLGGFNQGAIDINTGTLVMQAGSISILGGPGDGQLGGFRQSFIASNGDQKFTIDSPTGSLWLAGGFSSSNGSYGDRAFISQHGGTSSQEFHFYGGSDLLLEGGDFSGSGNLCYGSATVFCDSHSAEIVNYGSGGQSFTFYAPGSSITLKGGQGGINNYASIENRAGNQTIAGDTGANAPSISLLGGYGGAYDAALQEIFSNDAGLSSEVGLQTIEASSITVDARSVGGDVGFAGAYLAAPVQDISSAGSISVYGGTSSSIGLDGGTFFGGGMAVIGWDTTADITLNAGSTIFVGSGGGAYGSAGIGALTGNALINITAGNVTIDGALGGGTSGAKLGARAGTADIDLTVGTFNVSGSLTSYGEVGSFNKTGTISVLASGSGGINLGAYSQLRADTVDLSAPSAGGTSIFQASTGAIQANALNGDGNLSVQFFGTTNDVATLALNSSTGQALYYGGALTDLFADASGYGGVTINTGRNITLGDIEALNGTATITAAYGIFESNSVGSTDITALNATLTSTFGSLSGSTLAISADVDLDSAGTLTANVGNTASYGGISIRNTGLSEPATISLIDNSLDTDATVEYRTNNALAMSGTLSSASGSVLVDSGSANLDLSAATLSGQNASISGGNVSLGSLTGWGINGLLQVAASGLADLTGFNLTAGEVSISSNGLNLSGGTLSTLTGGIVLNAGTGTLISDSDILSANNSVSLDGNLIALSGGTISGATGVLLAADSGVVVSSSALVSSAGSVIASSSGAVSLSAASVSGNSVSLSAESLLDIDSSSVNASGGIGLLGGMISLTGSTVGSTAGAISAISGSTLSLDNASLQGATGVSAAASDSVMLDNAAQISAGNGALNGDIAIIAGGDLTLNNSSSIFNDEPGAPFANIFLSTPGNVKLDNGSQIVASDDIFIELTSSSSTLVLNEFTGQSASYIVADAVTGIPATIHLNFTSLSKGGVIIDGVETTTSLPGGSGFFTIDHSTPAVAGAGLDIVYGAAGVDPVSKEIGSIFDTNTRDTESINDVESEDVDKLAEEIVAEKESGEEQDDNGTNGEGNKDGSGKSKPAQCT